MLETLLKSLSIDPIVMALNAGLFIILLVFMNKVFWKPVTDHLERRKDEIAGAYDAVDRAKVEMERLREDYGKRLDQIEAEARQRIQQTVREAQAQREKALAEASAAADQILAQGAAEIAAERQETLVSLREKMDDVALAALEKATGAPTDSDQRALVDAYVARRVQGETA